MMRDNPVRRIVKGGYLYLHNFKPDRWPIGNPEVGYPNCDRSPTKSYILNTRRNTGNWSYWQMNFGKRDSDELYNIGTDPYCMNNLAVENKFASLKASMRKEMTQKLIKQQDPRMLGHGDVFDKYPYAGSTRNYYNRIMNGEKIRKGWIDDVDNDLKGR